ncbi:MAG TPA: transaldolase [Gemmatimonadales bacterium]|nr:transaldolase [Gemmatimonadales bacterium]
MSDRLQRLHDAGQSIWLDFIDRSMLAAGDLARMTREDSITGVTSNPTIFQKALAEGNAYDEQLASLSPDLSPLQLFEQIAAEDVRRACDDLREVYDRTGGQDGFVSLEVSPTVATDTAATVAEAGRLWALVDRPNLLIKVPGTEEGAVAVRALIDAGISVNITLLFSVDAHRRVIEAYLEGLEARARRNEPIDRIASVASFFVSRVDTEVDKRLGELMATASDDSSRAALAALRGRTAVANAKLAYRLFQAMFRGARWENLRTRGAMPQRPLWASTSTKNPAYRDVMYVEELIGPETVNTMPPATVEAFRDHGEVRRTIDVNVDEAVRTMQAIEDAGISMKDVTDKLLHDGLASFQKSFDDLLAGLEATRTRVATV